MSTPVAAILALAGTPQGDALGLALGTVVDDFGTANTTVCSVTLDGATTPVTVKTGYADRPAINDRVIVGAISKTLYLLKNTSAYSNGGVLNVNGPWNTNSPPNAFVGNAFTVTRAGYYMLGASLTGYYSATGSVATYQYLDGSYVAGTSFYFNQAAVHMTLPTTSWTRYLNRGTHYWWVWHTGSSDSGDSGSLSWTRI